MNLNLTLVSLPVVEIKNIQLNGNTVIIDVFYVSQQITLLKNDKNETIEGNPSQIDNVEDVWSFSRKLNSKENWLLINVNNA
jgi:predicted lipid-binding transport protein (Tim44 family)